MENYEMYHGSAYTTPVEADCSSDLVPAVDKKTSRVKVLADGITMTKYLFDHYRLSLYSFLNRSLRDGSLSGVVGFHVMNRVINREVCSFPMGGVSFWKIDRKNIYADVKVELKLQSEDGVQIWWGFLVCIVSFEGDIQLSVEALTHAVDHKDDGCVRLSPFLIAYRTGKEMDTLAENLLQRYMSEALNDPDKRDPVELARRMGLTVMYQDVYDHGGIASMLFFKEGELVIPPLPKRKRVAAYARVSLDKDAMLHSLAAQISYYKSLIQRKPDLEYAGVYADEGLTGTKENRPEFQRLLADCRAGKIDLVIVKSISRLARNTVTMLATVRELKALGIDVLFEKENIHSMSGDGELMLSILASLCAGHGAHLTGGSPVAGIYRQA